MAPEEPAADALGGEVDGDVRISEPPLERACRQRDLFQVQALLRDRADPNEASAVGEAPILAASAIGDLDVVALLLGHAADPSRAVPSGSDASTCGWTTEVRLLFRIFEERKVDDDSRRRLLRSLDPGTHAQVRNFLRLGERSLPFLSCLLSPAESLRRGAPVLVREATADHEVAVHVGDPSRPMLVLSPLWQAPPDAGSAPGVLMRCLERPRRTSRG